MGQIVYHTGVAANSVYLNGRSVVAMGNTASTEALRTAVVYSGMSVNAGGGGPTPVTGTDVKASIAGGTFAYWNDASYVGMRVSSTINGSGNTSLFFGSNNMEDQAINYITGVYLTNVSDWSYVSGIPLSSTAVNYSYGADDAATPTRAVPGELIYQETGGVPTSGEYVARTT